MGYHKMAAEHEAKYGPGLFQQIEETLSTIEGGLVGATVDEKTQLARKLQFYRDEMEECSDVHPNERDAFLGNFTAYLDEILKDPEVQESMAEDEELIESNEETELGMDEMTEDGDLDDDYEYEYEEDDEIDVDDELGLDFR
jgi:hypothetical protein